MTAGYLIRSEKILVEKFAGWPFGVFFKLTREDRQILSTTSQSLPNVVVKLKIVVIISKSVINQSNSKSIQFVGAPVTSFPQKFSLLTRIRTKPSYLIRISFCDDLILVSQKFSSASRITSTRMSAFLLV